MDIFKVLLGVLALLLAWAYMFRTGAIFKINQWLRDSVFSDQMVLFSRRRLAILMLILGGIALFSGIEGIIRDQPLKPQIASLILDRAEEDFQKKRFNRALKRAQVLIKGDPENLDGWILIAKVWWALGNKQQAKASTDAILRLDPKFPVNQYPIIKRIREHKTEGKS